MILFPPATLPPISQQLIPTNFTLWDVKFSKNIFLPGFQPEGKQGPAIGLAASLFACYHVIKFSLPPLQFSLLVLFHCFCWVSNWLCIKGLWSYVTRVVQHRWSLLVFIFNFCCKVRKGGKIRANLRKTLCACCKGLSSVSWPFPGHFFPFGNSLMSTFIV